MGGVLVDAVPSVVGLAVAFGLEEVGHFGCCYLLFLLLLKVCIVSLYRFGLAYSLLLVVAVPGGCYRFFVMPFRFKENVKRAIRVYELR